MVHALRLYTSRLCPFAHRVRLTLAEKGLAAEHVEIDPKGKPRDFHLLSPTGRIPLLEHGAVRIWESAVIMQYIEEAFPDTPLMPATPADRAATRLWLEFADNRVLAATHRMLCERDAAKQAAQAGHLMAAVEHVERHLTRQDADSPFLMGSMFTLADIALYPWFEQLAALEKLSPLRMPSACRRVLAWKTAVASRPAVEVCSQSDAWYEESYRREFQRADRSPDLV